MHYFNLDNMNSEVRAYIYQQIADLETVLPEGSQVSISINEDEKADENKIAAVIKVATPYGEVMVLGEEGDIYKTLGSAKVQLIKRLEEIHRALLENAASDRPALLETTIKARVLH